MIRLGDTVGIPPTCECNPSCSGACAEFADFFEIGVVMCIRLGRLYLTATSTSSVRNVRIEVLVNDRWIDLRDVHVFDAEELEYLNLSTTDVG